MKWAFNYRSNRIELFSDLWSSLEVFDNISKNKISLTDAVLLKLQFLHRNRKCAKSIELFRFKNGLNKLSRLWPNRIKSKMAHKMILFATYDDFQTLKSIFWKCSFYTLPHKKWRVIMLYPPKILKFWVSVRPSVSASFPDSNLSSFWLIFFKLCIDIDIGEEWFRIANGLNSFINNRVMVLDWCKNVISGL